MSSPKINKNNHIAELTQHPNGSEEPQSVESASRRNELPPKSPTLQRLTKHLRTLIMGTALCSAIPVSTGCSQLKAYSNAASDFSTYSKNNEPVIINGERLPSVGEMQKILHHALGDNNYFRSLYSTNIHPGEINESPGKIPKIDNFERINLTSEHISKYLEETFPVQ